MGILTRAIRGGMRADAPNLSFKGGQTNRLNADWAISILSSDQKIRGSLKAMRARCRNLVENNDYAERFINKARENVIGSNGVGLQMALDIDLGPEMARLNKDIELAWSRAIERISACGQMSLVDFANLWVTSFLIDGEAFVHRVRGYPHNRSHFALQFVDPDQVDIAFNRMRAHREDGSSINEIRMGVELDEWRRPVNYWVFDRHPAEAIGAHRTPFSADELSHSYIFKMLNQTRGIPWMHTAMSRMNMLGGYEEAELVGARLGSCKMAAVTSKGDEDYKPGQKDTNTGITDLSAEPASMFVLPQGFGIEKIDWNHPNQNFPEFTKSMLRGLAAGLNTSYSTLSGDLREVNFSSIRQGILDEREGWKVLQTFAIQHFYQPLFCDWLPMAITTGQIALPSALPIEVVLESATWTARGWDWVDPVKDVAADTGAVRAGMSTLADVAAKRGKDYRDIIDQRAKEIAYAREKGVPIDLTTSGALTGTSNSDSGASEGRA